MIKKTIISDLDTDSLLHNAEVLEGIRESKSNYRKIVRALIGKGIQAMKDGQIEVKSVDELERLMKLDLELQKEDYIL